MAHADSIFDGMRGPNHLKILAVYVSSKYACMHLPFLVTKDSHGCKEFRNMPTTPVEQRSPGTASKLRPGTAVSPSTTSLTH